MNNRVSNGSDQDGQQTDGTGLRYQAVVAGQTGKLAMLLFLSTEVMFFTAILGAYLVLRYSVHTAWPSASVVHVNLYWGLVNTFILLVSSATIAASVRCTRANQHLRAKLWLGTTLILAMAFLAVKGWEYREKFEIGLHPMQPRSLIYDQADDPYLSRVVAEMRQQVNGLESSRAEAKENFDEQQLQDWVLLQAGVVEWTQYKVGRSNDPLMRQRAREAMAHQIYPLGDRPELEKYLVDEIEETKNQEQLVKTQLQKAQEQLKQTQAAIKSLLPKSDAGDDDAVEALERENLNATRLNESIAEIQKELNPLSRRIDAVAVLKDRQGINAAYHLKLPMVIPAGNQWVNTYFLLTGFHALHLLAGAAVMAWLMLMRLSDQRSVVMENLALYWHFVDVVWLVVFSVVYLS